MIRKKKQLALDTRSERCTRQAIRTQVPLTWGRHGIKAERMATFGVGRGEKARSFPHMHGEAMELWSCRRTSNGFKVLSSANCFLLPQALPSPTTHRIARNRYRGLIAFSRSQIPLPLTYVAAAAAVALDVAVAAAAFDGAGSSVPFDFCLWQRHCTRFVRHASGMLPLGQLLLSG